eukprot:CAMPEP_0170171744 /NCGR_PEP_ID=MMETSP0040_2-20121228/4917_1 /TAXON_ID=641309 /ORGANISM="Lotharella oceanica, Strain CCMP622" /LENGTH=280 /DNA_ID=CAMNT_0010411969 /DNA_START=106 /DNA_END=948 /DNA_ORIENTATION=-
MVVSGGLGIAAYTCARSASAEVKEDAEKMLNLFSDYTHAADKVAAFGKYATAEGKMTKNDFIKAFKKLGVSDEAVISSFFECFDGDHDGLVSFESFASAVAVVSKPGLQAQEKLDFVFQCCDISGDGILTKDELTKVIRSLMLTRERLYVDECKNAARYNASPIGTLEPSSWSNPEQRKRLSAIRQEFPNLKHSTMEEALEKLSQSIGEEIFREASMESKKKNGGLDLEDFRKWARKGTADAAFLASLFEGLQPAYAFTKTEEYRRDMDNVHFLDGATMF